jgi:hypothetical protein
MDSPDNLPLDPQFVLDFSPFSPNAHSLTSWSTEERRASPTPPHVGIKSLGPAIALALARASFSSDLMAVY